MRGPTTSLLAASVALALGACGARLAGNGGELGDDDGDGGLPDDGGLDAEPDAPLGPFGAPQKITVAAVANVAEDDGTLSSNGLELVFAVVDTTDNNRKHLFYAQRASLDDEFANRQKLPFNVTGSSDETPRFSADDKTLYFASSRAPTKGDLDIFQVSHSAPGNNWGTPQKIDEVSTAATDKWFMKCGNAGRYLMITANDLAEGVLGSGVAPKVDTDLSAPAAAETGTFLTQDCLNIYFASQRNGMNQLFRSSRTAIGQRWGTPTVVDDFKDLGGAQQDPWISSDGRIFALTSDAGGSNDLYISRR